MKNEILAVVVAGLLIAVFGAGYFVSVNSQQTVNTPLTGFSLSSIDGLILNANISSKTLPAGGTLGITISLYNSLSTEINLAAASYNSSSWKV